MPKEKAMSAIGPGDRQLYQSSLALLTDFYELTMAYSYWKRGMDRKEAVFHHFFRRAPFKGGYTIAAGLESLIQFLERFRYTASDLDYLASLRNPENEPHFSQEFLRYLADLRFTLDIDAVPEGTVVFPYEPLVRISGLLIQAQLLETPLLNILNYSSLIATKASRICLAAQGDAVVEFGLRRAQGIDGGISASRSAYIGGCEATSNVLAGKLFGIPVRGTQAHSWIMVFADELESFQAYAETTSGNSVFLVDTYDTLNGVRRAIQVGRWLKERGHRLQGIRLDSGDLAYLSVKARQLLDASGFTDTKIMASNELDETIISDLKRQGARINVWGVGTHLVTGWDSPALDGVYKLSAVRDGAHEPWSYRLKLSEQMSKVSNPGILQLRRYAYQGENIADMLYDVRLGAPVSPTIIDPLDPTRQKQLSADMPYSDLLVPIFRQGKVVYSAPPIQEIQRRVKENLRGFDDSIKRYINPHVYVMGMEQSLYDLKVGLIKKIRYEARSSMKTESKAL